MWDCVRNNGDLLPKLFPRRSDFYCSPGSLVVVRSDQTLLLQTIPLDGSYDLVVS